MYLVILNDCSIVAFSTVAGELYLSTLPADTIVVACARLEFCTHRGRLVNELSARTFSVVNFVYD